jgi:uncharacterized protein YndB with AHSA1/START domain
MPSFADTGRSAAPPEEVWKLLCDSSRLPDWWAGNGSPLSDVRFEWRLEADNGGTRIDVLVDVPEEEASQLEEQRDLIRASLLRLAEVAAVAPL